jgi:hypothetical protein
VAGTRVSCQRATSAPREGPNSKSRPRYMYIGDVGTAATGPASRLNPHSRTDTAPIYTAQQRHSPQATQ